MIAKNNFQTSIRKLEFSEFWELFVCIAIQAFKDKHWISPEDKVKALLMCMWRHLEDTMGSNMKGARAVYKS